MVKKGELKSQGALIEGSGVFQCSKHEFETRSIEEWNKHWTSYGVQDGHYEEGNTVCISCGEVIEFTELPPVPFKPDGSKGIMLQCDDCSQATRGSAKITKRSKAE